MIAGTGIKVTHAAKVVGCCIDDNLPGTGSGKEAFRAGEDRFDRIAVKEIDKNNIHPPDKVLG
jgi:hypothetical protein